MIVADDSALLREGICALLEEAGHHVVARLADATELSECAETLDPDLVIVDIRMPPTHTTEGLEAAISLRAAHPTLPVVVLSQHIETRYAMQLIAAGAAGIGYLLKDRITAVDDFLDAIERVRDGETVIDPDVITRLVGRRRRRNPLDALSGREREVLDLMAQGLTNGAIAQRLVINLRTVETHVSSIFTKLGLTPEVEIHRRVQAVLFHLDNAEV